VNFTVAFPESVTDVDIIASFNDFGLIANLNITGASVTSISPVSGTTYTVGVNTGSGNGTTRFDVIDNDSIVDSGGHPLGGVGAGNGNLTTGKTTRLLISLPQHSISVTMPRTALEGIAQNCR
jgi:hypothetical protein